MGLRIPKDESRFPFEFVYFAPACLIPQLHEGEG